MKESPRVLHKDAHTAAVEKPIIAFIDEVLWGPMADALAHETKQNDAGTRELELRIRDGRITYKDGAFRGNFNAKSSGQLFAMGAKFDKRSMIFRIDINSVPFSVRNAIYETRDKSEAFSKALIALLGLMLMSAGRADTAIDETEAVSYIVADLHRQAGGMFHENKWLEQELRRNMDEAIDAGAKAILLDSINRLKTAVNNAQKNGATFHDLEKIVEKHRATSLSRAKMLAEHQTAVFIANYREGQYRALGSRSYFWNTQRDERVRAGHVLLDRRIFQWDSPPIEDPATGERGHPGHPPGCRCFPTAIIPDA